MNLWFPILALAIFAFLAWESRGIGKGEVQFNLHVVRRSEKPGLFRLLVAGNLISILLIGVVLVLWALDFNAVRTGY